jgi:hypothetical protein
LEFFTEKSSGFNMKYSKIPKQIRFEEHQLIAALDLIGEDRNQFLTFSALVRTALSVYLRNKLKVNDSW